MCMLILSYSNSVIQLFVFVMNQLNAYICPIEFAQIKPSIYLFMIK